MLLLRLVGVYIIYINDALSNKYQISRIYCTGKSVRFFFISRIFFCHSFLPAFPTLPHASRSSFAQVFCPSAFGLLRHLSSRAPTSLFTTGRLRVQGQVEGLLLGLVLPRRLVFRRIRKTAKSEN